MRKTFAAIMAAVMIFFGSAQVALAQWDYDDYADSTYDYSDYSAEAGAAGIFAGLGVLAWAIWCCAAILGLGFGIFRIIMIIHAVRFAPDDQKILWVLLMIFVPFVDFVYFFTKRREWDPKFKGSAKKEVAK